MKSYRRKQRTLHSCVDSIAFLKVFLISFCFLFAQVFAPVSWAQTEITVDREDIMEISRIKSAYLYNFLKYIELDENIYRTAQNKFIVCVLGSDPFGSSLDAMSTRKAKGFEVEIRRVNAISKAQQCHVVYISQSEKLRLEMILNKLGKTSILTVSDIKDFTKQGGIIGFVASDKKIGIEINLNNARIVNIKISALLLEIAKVIDNHQGGD